MVCFWACFASEPTNSCDKAHSDVLEMGLRKKRIAVLGGGLQGACVALELAGHEAQVDLYERNNRCLSETSANNEGKVHLGYVYAYDKSFKTARMMIDGALCFERLMRRWIGDSIDNLPTSSPFQYLVHRNGLMTTEAFEVHALRTTASIAEKFNQNVSPYFGRDLRRPLRRLKDFDVSTSPRTNPIIGAFETEEIGIDPEALSLLVGQRLGEVANINCLSGRTVSTVRDDGKSLLVESTDHDQTTIERYDFVVNTLGSDRLRIDAQMGIQAKRAWAFRLKYFLRVNSVTKSNVNSATMVLGPFGDIVNYGNGSLYLSWYPAGMTEWSSALFPPDRPLRLEGDPATAMVQDILRGLAGVVPEIGNIELRNTHVNGGWIFSFGQTDIDDPTSEFHERFDVGVRSYGRYLTIDTGKLTLAPMFAERAVDMLKEH